MMDLSPESKDIVDGGRAALAPSAAASERVRAAVTARVAHTAGGAAGGTSAAGGIGGAIKLVVLSGVVLGVVVTAFVAWRHRGEGRAQPVETVVDRASPEQAPTLPAELPTPLVVPALEESRIDQSAGHRPVRTRRPIAADSRPSPSPAPPGLGVELAILEQARRAIGDGEPSDALTALDTLEQQVPVRQMDREASLLRAEALCASGDARRAGLVLDAAASRWPSAPGVEAVRRRCEDGERK